MRHPTDRFAGFKEVVTSFDEVREVIGDPPQMIEAKVIDHLDDVCRSFIATSPFCLIASSDPSGHIDISPKGDPAGFVRVLDNKHLAVPDRPGNRRVDTFHNLLKDPRLGMIFIIPGRTETLRISGEARIVRDEELRKTMAVDGKVPALAVVVYVERAFMHCPKCMIRSKIWQPEDWPDSTAVPTIGQAMIKHAHLRMTEDEQFAEAERLDLTRMY